MVICEQTDCRRRRAMDIATVLLTYNRSYHTGEVINALSQNTVLPKTLYIFQDGLRKEEHRAEWEKVNRLIREADFCPTTLYVSDTNKGVANSVISGVGHALSRHDAVIVIEDDCVPAVNFMRFMEQCLEKYREDERVWCVGGFNDPIEVERDIYDVYGCGRTSSWGWGTWKDRWRRFSFDNDILKRLKRDEKKSGALATWGNDCGQMLLSNVAGKGDIWDVYWSLLMLEAGGICVLPYESLVRNIGLDGTGTHCGASDKFRVNVSNDKKEKFLLPDSIGIRRETERAYVDLYGSYTAINTEGAEKENVIIYGMGKFFRQHEKELNERYYVKAFIDRRETGWYAGKKFIEVNEIGKYEYEKVIIMVLNVNECFRIIQELTRVGVGAEKIMLGQALFGIYGEVFDTISVLPDGMLSLELDGAMVKVGTKDEFDDVYEVFGNQRYNYHINNGKRDVILDVGARTKASSFYFRGRENVEKVYEYEPDVEEVGAVIDKYHFHYNVVLVTGLGERAWEMMKRLSRDAMLDKAALVMLKCRHEKMEDMREILKKSGFSWQITRDGDMDFVYAYR
ncbi:MAG: glycosyltransferase family 2 protein [Ruminococcus sp.]|nr:glycosyltransferase family 2 protein [Ruminococcus sp.]